MGLSPIAPMQSWRNWSEMIRMMLGREAGAPVWASAEDADSAAGAVVSHWRRVCDMRTFSSMGPAHQLAHFLLERADAARVDHFIRLAEVIQVVEPSHGAMAELGASAVADGLILADLALGMRQRLLAGEAVAPGAARDLRPGIELDVAELPGAFHEKVARVD